MEFESKVFRRSCDFFRQKLIFTLLFVIIVIIFSVPLFATVSSGEIIPSSVSATISSTFDPINGYSITFQWTTVHPGNSIVVIEDSDDYAFNNNYSNRQIVQNDNVTNHTVVVDHFPAYRYYATWGYYVASQQQSGTWASYPGPATAACTSTHIPGCGGSYLTFRLATAPTNPNGTLAFTLWPVGGQNVYQGDPTESPACTPTAKNSRECNQPEYSDSLRGACPSIISSAKRTARPSIGSLRSTAAPDSLIVKVLIRSESDPSLFTAKTAGGPISVTPVTAFLP